jgi:hypothetical protein
MKFLPLFCICLLLLAGCAGVGIVATSDPMTKLNDTRTDSTGRRTSIDTPSRTMRGPRRTFLSR